MREPAIRDDMFTESQSRYNRKLFFLQCNLHDVAELIVSKNDTSRVVKKSINVIKYAYWAELTQILR